jgi:arginine-tRNA-protein transferase
MFTEKHFPDSIAGEELDSYLERAWYRMGTGIFTTHFLFFDDSLYSAIWLRQPLGALVLRKSVQKILRQNRARFRTVIHPGRIDDEKEAVFQKYRKVFKGRMSETLRESLLDGKENCIFDTYEVCIYEGEKLVAFSFFDLGKLSLASIKGVYDPNYSQYSLGIYTMIEEMLFGQELGFEFYYPGYVVPGFNRFDYKLRLGRPEQLQFFDLKQQQWLAMTEFNDRHIPVILLSNKLTKVGQALFDLGICAQMLFYPAYEAINHYYENERFLESPLFLTLYNNVFPRPRFIVYYDLWKDKYVFTHCMPVEDLGLYFEYTMQFDTKEAHHFLDFILKKTQIVETEDPNLVVQLAIEIGKLIKPTGTPGILK